MDDSHPLDFGLLVTAEAICREIDQLVAEVASIAKQLEVMPPQNTEGDESDGDR